jgi:DNA-directed RNA polymerase sigma subunit (sigma70/sigma32)
MPKAKLSKEDRKALLAKMFLGIVYAEVYEEVYRLVMARIIELETQIPLEPVSLDIPLGEEDNSDKIIDLIASRIDISEEAINNTIGTQCCEVLGSEWKRKLRVIIAYSNLPEPKENWAGKIARKTGEKQGFVCKTIRSDFRKLKKHFLGSNG